MAKATKKKSVTKAAQPPVPKPTKKKLSAKAAKLPLPKNIPVKKARIRKAVLKAEAAHLKPLELPTDGDALVLDRLWTTIEARRVAGNAAMSHSARLLSRGTPKVAQKLGEEAVELVIEAVSRNRDATISETADVLYHLMVLLVDAGIQPAEIWAELRRREGLSGIVEKASRSRPKGLMTLAQTSKLA